MGPSLALLVLELGGCVFEGHGFSHREYRNVANLVEQQFKACSMREQRWLAPPGLPTISQALIPGLRHPFLLRNRSPVLFIT